MKRNAQIVLAESEPTKKAVIYCRVSSKNQETEGGGLQSQETRCRQHARAKSYEVAAVFPDTFTGGGDFMKRPGMVALLSFLDAQPDEDFVVIFDDLKRFARDRDFHFALRRAFRARNAEIECLNFKFDDTPEGEFIETIMAAQGQLERKQNGRQVSQKMRARMENGFWIHNAPPGYKYETIKGRGKVLVFDGPFDKIVKEGLEGYASGRFQSQAEVKRFFESFPDFPLKRKPNGELRQQRITNMLTNPIYTGYICSERYELDWHEGQHDGLISIETFEKIQNRRSGTSKAPKRKNIGEHFALRGIVSCAGCSVPLRSSITRGNGGNYAYYLCQTKSCDHYGKSIKRDEVEGQVGDLIKRLQPTKPHIQFITALFRYAWDQRQAQAKEIAQSAQSQLKQLEKQIENFLNRIIAASNQTVITTYEGKISQLEKEKRLIAEKVQSRTKPQSTMQEKLEPVLQFLTNPWKLWENGNIHLRRTVLKLAFIDRIQYDRFEGARTPQLSLPFKALGGNHDCKVFVGGRGGT